MLPHEKGLGSELGDAPVHQVTDLFGPIRLALEALRIRPFVMSKGLICSVRVVQRLAKSKVEVKTIFIAKIRQLKRRLHRCKISMVELDRLQIGKAPPCITKRGLQLDRL